MTSTSGIKVFVGMLFMIYTVSLYFFATAPPFLEFMIFNVVLQVDLFVVVASIPCFMTGKMSFVDIAWPWGLVLIGVQVLFFAPGYLSRRIFVGLLYSLAGLRMGIPALVMWSKGWLKSELPRYEFQKLRWAHAKKSSVQVAMQMEIFVQAWANVSVLLVPVLLAGFNIVPQMEALEIIGGICWISAILFETIADIQKEKFIRQMKKQGNRAAVCDIGLWSFSRHPNYFGEWMVWNSLVFISLPSLYHMLYVLHPLVWFCLLAGLISIPLVMYNCLVYYTGAFPSEYFSVQTRHDYVQYRRRTSVFIPLPPLTDNDLKTFDRTFFNTSPDDLGEKNIYEMDFLPTKRVVERGSGIGRKME